MNFGPVPVAAAAGAVLAHGLDLPGGRLRKGRVLSEADVAALQAAGLAQVTVARLGPGDLGEDAAAQRIAEALVGAGAGVRLSPAHTGRVNVMAGGPGIARIDAAAVDALNAVDPAITLATVPRWQRMDRGGLIATVKIIAYGVAAAAVDRAVAVGSGAVGLRPPVVRDVALIETTVGAAGDKGYRAFQGRLARLGVAEAGRVLVPHEVGALAAALRGSQAEVLCILTGSATSDIRDVAPEAVRVAGGTVAHFGMPVDPGNLLFIGALGGRVVIGLPGCARSPALNGADWVLERVLCGVPVGPADIQRMGVGGLLKEIPTRPQPRRRGEGVTGA